MRKKIIEVVVLGVFLVSLFLFPAPASINSEVKAGFNLVSFSPEGKILTGMWLMARGYPFSRDENNQSQVVPQSVNTATVSKLKVKSEPVPGAEITIEQIPTPISTQKTKEAVVTQEPAENTGFEVVLKSAAKARVKTDEKGGFSVIIADDLFNRLGKEFSLIFTIKPLQPAKYPVETDQVKVTLKKAAGPKYDFIVTWEKLTAKTNKGCFAVNPKAQS